MVVEYALPAALPAGLVAWHYAVQLSRPMWGHGSDKGRRRTPWIVSGHGGAVAGRCPGGRGGGLLAARAAWGYSLAILSFAMIGAGVGAAGTSLLALLAARVAPARRAAAASSTWIMMIAGIVVTAGVAGKLIDPFSSIGWRWSWAAWPGGASPSRARRYGESRGACSLRTPSPRRAGHFRAALREMMADAGGAPLYAFHVRVDACLFDAGPDP